MPLLVYSLLRLALFVACWLALVWAGLNAWIAVIVAALAAWGLSYVAMRGPRDAAAGWLAEQEAKRRGVPQLSARARKDAADEDALVDALDDEVGAEGAADDEPAERHPGAGHDEPADGRPGERA